MKYLLFILLIFSNIPADAQKHSQHQNLKKLIRVKEYYSNGELKEKGKNKLQRRSSYLVGKSCHMIGFFKLGRWTEYYESGCKKRVVLYDRGKLVKEIRNWTDCN